MGFTSSSATDKNQVVGIVRKLTGAQLLDLSLLHGRCAIVECGKVFMVGNTLSFERDT